MTNLGKSLDKIILSRNVREKDLEELAQYTPENIVDEMSNRLDIPDVAALSIAAEYPHQKYEQTLLGYDETSLTDVQTIYWMLILGDIGSEKAYERIEPFVNTPLFYQAFIALTSIDVKKGVERMAGVLEKKSTETFNPVTAVHDSGETAIRYIAENISGARQEMEKYEVFKKFLHKES